MASFRSLNFPLLAILLPLITVFSQPVISCYTSIFSFGDSLADTGNLIRSPGEESNHAARPPYGETYFHRPTGRFSDGRIVLDFIAEAMGLPLLPPLLGGSSGGQDFRHGVNFAVAGATALDNDFFRQKGMHISWTNYSLGVQMEWFKQLLPSLCNSKSDCDQMVSKSLFMMGEIGGNDYNYAFFQGKTLDEIRTFAPLIVDVISSAITDLIRAGARTLVVPGNLPIGCNAIYLTIFQTPIKEEYDSHTGCIKWLNEFAEYHNHRLLEELDQIRRRYPYATIIYADYYNTTMKFYQSPHLYGFGEASLAACCGGGGPYNCNRSAMCGNANATVCNDPSKHINWDGIHLTEAAYRQIANGLLNGALKAIVNNKCPQIEHKVGHSQGAVQSM